MRTSDPRRIQKRLFVCQICGNVTPATKRLGTTREGHVKTMWCWKCRKETDHIQAE